MAKKDVVDKDTGEVFAAPQVPLDVRPMLRAAYDDHMPMSNATGLFCDDGSRTQQSFAEEVDINTIVRRFGLTGQLPSNVRAPQYADFTDAMDFRQSMDAILRAEDSFNAMPADVRARFHNNAAEFVDFCSDDKNRDELGKLGLLMPEAWEKRQAELKALEEAEFARKAAERGYAVPGKPEAPPKEGKGG